MLRGFYESARQTPIADVRLEFPLDQDYAAVKRHQRCCYRLGIIPMNEFTSGTRLSIFATNVNNDQLNGAKRARLKLWQWAEQRL